MIRGLLGALLAAALVLATGVAVIFAVTIGALILPRGQETGDLVLSLAWAVLTAAVLGVGGLAFLHWVLAGPRPAPAARIGRLAFAWRARGRCPVCRTAGARRDLAWCERCLTPHHDDCWRYVGKCAVFGCGGTAARAARREP